MLTSGREPCRRSIREARRLDALARYDVLDTPSDEAFDRVTRLAARMLGAPVALVSLVDVDRQFFKSAVGLDEPWATRRETPLSHSFCQHVVAAEGPLVIEDAREHPLVRDNRAVVDWGVVSYLGVPLRVATGDVLGSLCIIDTSPRRWTEAERETLESLSAMLTIELELRLKVREAEAADRGRAADRALLQASLDALTDLFVVVGPGGRLLRWNERVPAVTGYPPEKLAGIACTAFFDAAGAVRIEEALRRALHEGQASVEVTLVTRGGRRIPYEFNGRPLLNADGVPVGVCGTGRDLTERRAAEQALRSSESRFRSFVEATTQVVWTADAEGTVREMSRTWAAFTGQSEDEICGWGWADALHPADRSRIAAEWEVHLAAQTPYRCEYRVRRRDGVYHWFAGHAVPLFGPDGGFTEWIGTCVDIEERKRAEEQLRESEARYRNLVEQASDGIFISDLEGHLLEVNERACALTGYDREELLGLHTTALLADAAPDGFEVNRARIRAGEPVLREQRLRRKDGTTRVAEVSVAPVGALVQATVRDVTDRKAQEEALRAAKREAEEMAAAKSALLNNMSHEIRTPLTAIIGFADLLAELLAGAPEAEPVEMVRVIQRSGHRLLETLNSVLDLAQIEAGTMRLDLKPLDVAEVAAGMAELFEREATAKGLALTYAPPGRPLRALADRRAVQRILANLVSNAVKFTEEGDVTVRVEPSGADELVVSVADTGAGMSTAFLAKVFEPFQQESTGLTRERGGSGLGLTIVKHLAELMGGRVEVESRKGEGSTVRVVLRRVEP